MRPAASRLQHKRRVVRRRDCERMRRSETVLLALLIAMAGAGLAQGQVILAAHLGGGQLPDTGLFRTILLSVWLPLFLIALVAGFYGGYRAIRDRNLANRLLVVFAVLFSFVLKVDGYELGWSYLRLAVTIGGERLAFGVNFVGLILLAWLLSARSRALLQSRDAEFKQVASAHAA